MSLSFEVKTNNFSGMMRMKVLFCAFLGFVLMCSDSSAQDLHYSYYHFTPLSVNPANTGAFHGSYRIGGIYTSKDGAISDRSFKNFSLTADAPISRGLRKQDWIGIGVQADVLNALNGAGDISAATESTGDKYAQNWTFIKMSAAYHLSFDKNQKNILTIGAQFNNGNRLFPSFSSDDTRNGIINSTDLDLINYKQLTSSNDPDKNTKFSSRDLGIGILFNSRTKTSDFRIGFAMEGLLKPKVGLFSNSSFRKPIIDPNPNPNPNPGQPTNVSKDSVETKPLGMSIHGDYRLDFTPRTSIEPSFYFYKLGPFTAFNVNSHIWYQIDPDKDFKGGVGLGVRNVRDVIMYLGARFNAFQVGLSYDLNVNERTLGSSGLGGMEMAIRYIGVIYKKPKVKPVIFCPRL
ncbi:MAG: type IX secretion system membrane protein PorP/SprF [Saprospiraceae bacterium]|nr:MAG: bacteroidetes-specific membrane protein [Bacteroidetes bacterium OLB9]MCO6464201.1 type IX secretion system membrane protein PorP/SprF [Saprospiraceae bacterium]